MEIIIALVLVVVGVTLFYNRKSKAVETTVEESVPYKVETPVVVVAETKEEVKVEEAPAKKTRKPRATKPVAKPAAKKVAAKKPAVTKARKPKAK